MPVRLAFVLLSELRLPKGKDVVQLFAAFGTKGQSIQLPAGTFTAGPKD